MRHSNKHKTLCHSCAFTGRERTEEYRQKISNSLKGRTLSEDVKKKIFRFDAVDKTLTEY